MKKNLIIIAAMAVAAVACSKEADVNNEAKTVISVSMAQTKTAFGEESENSIPVLWNEGDQINVNGVESDELVSGGSESAEFTFSGTLTEPYNAVYPASAYSEAGITLPSTQYYYGDSFDPKAGILVGKGNAEGITMVNAMSYLKIVLTGNSSTIASLTISSNGGEALCGKFSTDFETISPAGDNSNELYIYCPSMSVGESVIVALPAQTYSSGITIVVSKFDGTKVTKTSRKSATMEAGHLYTTNLNITTDEYYLVGGGFTKYSEWTILDDLKLVCQEDGTYVSEKDIYLNQWCYFRIANADYSQDYSRVQGASDYWSVQPKASGDEEPFIPGNSDSSWKDGYYMVQFDKVNMTLRCVFVGNTVNEPFYLVGGNFDDGVDDWAFDDSHKLTKTDSGYYVTENPVKLAQWVYFKFATADWGVEYIRDASSDNYWSVVRRTGDDDIKFELKNHDYNWIDGMYYVGLDLRTMTMVYQYASPIPGDTSSYIYIYGGGFTDSSWDWAFVDDLALTPTGNANEYATSSPVALNVGCYFKFDKKDWTEYRRDENASEYWTAKENTDPDTYFTVEEDGKYYVTFNTGTMEVGCYRVGSLDN